ncbi:DUF748 domain-containing protein [Coraliomargarita sp. SDUM461004]|uniref:DUF748 domain-containing protein n=1 Tax=Thalassobacterium sedimentorum TaxID=3041258 RepID=A0ABU1AEK5_9BACT|nr:DUF748 domain-containing protein [Coraliomargarita sp. SDUM461004]MDQ8193155.1 DUF748 domain-containing protein [Coraliomargarita sp. SDUM461004]
MNRFSKVLVLCGALLIWYALLGFLIAPALIRHFGESELRAQFSSESKIDAVRINPFSGSLRVEGLSLMDREGAWSLAWQQAEVNVSMSTLIRFYPVFDLVRLVGADIRYEKRPVMSTTAATTDNTATAGDWRALVETLNLTEIPELRVDLLEVAEGRAEFVDQTAQSLYRKVADPINFTLRDLTTVVEGETAMRFVAQTDDGALLSWEGDFHSQPIRSAGTFSLSGLAVHDLSPYYAQFIRFRLQRALLGLSFDYRLDLSNLEDLLRIQNGQVSLTELLCQPLGQEDSFLSLDAVTLEGLEFHFPSMALDVAHIQFEAGELHVSRDSDGLINLTQLLARPDSAEESGPTASAPAVNEATLPSLSYRIEQLELSNYRIVWEDLLPEERASLVVEIPHLQLTGLTSDLEAPFQLSSDYLIEESGAAHIAGTVAAAGPELDLVLQVEQLPLTVLTPYAQHFGGTLIEGGTFNFDGHLKYAGSGEQFLLGEVIVNDAAFIYDENVVANWSKLGLDGLRMQLSPFALALESLVLEQPELLVTKKSSPEIGLAPESGAAPVEVGAQESQNVRQPVRIDAIEVRQGHLSLIDESVQPVSHMVMNAMELELLGLDLSDAEPAQLIFSGEINDSSFQLEGGLNASHLKESTHFKASLNGLSLPAFSSYSGQAVGRRIVSGQFNLESDWQIQANQLQASNRIRIEQLEFGDKVESEGALKLPLDLAVTLLKGPNGVMDLSLPLSGDLSDPKVGIGQIVRTAIVGLITNVATAPFKLLSGLVASGDEDLSLVQFDVGSAKLAPAMITRLNTLAAALKERPGLRLVITAQISSEDEQTLAEAQLRRELLGESDFNDEKLYETRLFKRYREWANSAKDADVAAVADVEVDREQILQVLLPAIQLSNATRMHLAANRAEAVREHLMTAQGIAAERLSIAEPQLDTSDSVAQFDLKHY